jgi:NAD(P)H-flavin reductase
LKDRNLPASLNMQKELCKTQANITCEILDKYYIGNNIISLNITWPGPPPKAGQFFMLKPVRSSVFLPRPLSVAIWESLAKAMQFLFEKRGKGTHELADKDCGDYVELTGPLGNAWSDFLPEPSSVQDKPIALVGGGLGIAPLKALVQEALQYKFDFYCGFKSGFKNDMERIEMLEPALEDCNKLVIATEDGSEGRKGLILDFFEPEDYAAVCTCGPAAMLKAVAAKCRAANVPCFVSMEQRMACGVGACLGCTIETASGNRRCCADGPIFRAEDVFFVQEPASHE